MNDRTVIPLEISEDAADWFGRLETGEPSEATRTEFVRWLTRSPAHIEEFLRVAAVHHALSRELKANSEWLAGVLAESGAPDDNVVWMVDAQRPAPPAGPGRAPRRAFLWKAAAVLLAAVGIGALVSVTGLPRLGGRGQRFATAVGEQHRVVLSDGSGVLLNTDTEIRVRMSRDLRLVELLRGEAIFDVEKDPSRPLRVISGNVAVQAIGTRFVVYRQQQGTLVTVVEGRVLVSPVDRAAQAAPPSPGERAQEPPPGAAPRPAPETKQPVSLGAGQRVSVATDGTVAAPAAADVESTTSWARGRLVFDAATLDTVVAEFNRYTTERVVIAEPALGDRRVTGVFKLGDPGAFLALLSDLDDVSVERTADGGREIRFKPGRAHRAEDGSRPSAPSRP